MSKGPAPTWGREKVPTTSKRVAPALTGVIDVDMAGDVENAPPSKDDVLNKVKNIEFLLKSVSNHSPDLKADLTIKLDEARQELRGTKPLGARLDALKGAIARNEEKLEEANAAVAKAVSHQETVQDKLMELRTARAVVEMDLASGGDVGVEASGAPSATAAVEALMQRINDMQRQQDQQILQIAAFMNGITADSLDKQREIQQFASALEGSIATPVLAAAEPAVRMCVQVAPPVHSVTDPVDGQGAQEQAVPRSPPGTCARVRGCSSPPNTHRQTTMQEHGFGSKTRSVPY